MSNSEKAFDYIAEAQLTLSSSFHGELVPLRDLSRVLGGAIGILNELDGIKKALFYGKPYQEEREGFVFQDCATLPNSLGFAHCTPEGATNIIHAIIGKATEAGELLEALADAIFTNNRFDAVNAREEVGDGFWYDAILLKEINSTFDEAQRINISKLRSRFPNKFTEYDANNRDLSNERKILEDNDFLAEDQ